MSTYSILLSSLSVINHKWFYKSLNCYGLIFSLKQLKPQGFSRIIKDQKLQESSSRKLYSRCQTHFYHPPGLSTTLLITEEKLERSTTPKQQVSRQTKCFAAALKPTLWFNSLWLFGMFFGFETWSQNIMELKLAENCNIIITSLLITN